MDIFNDKSLVIVSIAAAITVIVIFISLTVIIVDKRNTNLRLMTLCVENGETFDECKFGVYGGIRINLNENTDEGRINE